MLCDSCKSIFASVSTAKWVESDGWVPIKQIPHDQSSPRFENAAREGCYICSAHLRLQEPHHHDHIVEIYDTHDKGHEYLLFLFCSTFILKEAARTTAERSKASLSNRPTGSQAAVDLVNEWLYRCLAEHSTCAQNLHPTWYPTRLLEVAESRIRLIHTSCQRPKGAYATLSHCWGTVPFETLSTTNIHIFADGMPLSWFPATFRDAIDFVRRLKIRYLWIDCFCILQHGTLEGVAKDQSTEISSMQNVYANSLLNVGAAHGSNPFKGCFVERDQEPFPAKYTTYEGIYSGELEHVMCDLGTGRGMRQYQIINSDDRETLQQSLYWEHPLFTRAWVLQERMLSPRMLYFGENQLHWECSSYGWASEEFPHGPGKADTPGRPPFSLSLDKNVFGRIAIDGEGSWWHNIVRAYSRLRLSRPEEDRLVALAGIAEQAAQRLQDEYVAGFFRNTLVWDLDFICVIMGDCTGPPRNLNNELPGPSWSWASKRFSVRFAEGDSTTRSMMKLHGYNVQLMDSNVPYGAVCAGELVLTSRLIEVKILKPIATMTSANVNGSPTRIAFFPDDRKSLQWNEALESTLVLMLLNWTTLHNSRDDTLQMIKDGFVNVHANLSGLVLRKESDGTYRRIGALTRGNNTSSVLDLLKIWAKQEETLFKLQ